MPVPLVIALVLVIALATYIGPLRRWFFRWGATAAEFDADLPGDDIVPDPETRVTRAITIHAAPTHVYPWLVQIGWQRGGLYSYERLENMVGCDLHNADSIVPAWQNTRVGDLVRMGPEGYPALKVAAVEPDQAFIMHWLDPKTLETVSSSWAFVIVPQGDGRVLARSRARYGSVVERAMFRVAVEPIHFMMERKMLLGIKQRAEALAAAESERAQSEPAPV